MIRNRDILDWLQRVLRKETRGNVVSMRDFNTYLAVNQRKRFDWLMRQMELTGRVVKSLEGYQHTDVLSLSVDGIYGKVALSALSSYLEKPLRCMYLFEGAYTRADWVTQLELEERLSNSLTYPTVEHPVYVMEGGEIHVYPYTAGATVQLTYIATPPKAYLDWVVRASRTVRYLDAAQLVVLNQGQGEVYPNASDNTSNPLTSLTQEMLWSQEDSISVADMILRNIAPSIADQGAYQFSSEESAKSEQL